MTSLRTRLLFGAVIFISTALLIAAFVLTALFERHVTDWIDRELEGHLDRLIANVERASDGTLTVKGAPDDSRFETPLSGLYWQVMFADGKIERSRSLWDVVLDLPPEASRNAQSHHHAISGPHGQTLYLIQKKVEMPQRLGRSEVLFAVALDKAQVNSAVWRFAGALAPFLIALGVLLLAATWLQVGLGLKPLSSIRLRVEQIRSGFAKRLGSDFPSEVRPLAQEIDTLLDGRERQLVLAKARAGDLAHGLKTPLQVIVGGIGKLKAAGETAIATDLEYATHLMQRHVDRQLIRARMVTDGSAVQANVGDVAARVVRVLEKATRQRELSWSIDVPSNLCARIHPDDLSEALGALAENAGRHATSAVVISATRKGQVAFVTIYDDGPGIPEKRFEEMLQRGRRLDNSPDGTGLGLSIAADIAEACGGVLARNSERMGMFGVTLQLAIK